MDDEEAAGDKDYEIREEDKEEEGEEEVESVPLYKVPLNDEEEAKKDEEELTGENYEFDRDSKPTKSSTVNQTEGMNRD